MGEKAHVPEESWALRAAVNIENFSSLRSVQCRRCAAPGVCGRALRGAYAHGSNKGVRHV
jgi:hypothetical protein